LAACVAFLSLNGWSLTAQEDEAANFVLRVAEGRFSKEDAQQWIEQNVRPRPSFELREFFAQLNYSVLYEKFDSIAAGGPSERKMSMLEAGQAIPAVTQANIGAMHAEEHGDEQSAMILRQHAMLLTAMYRLAEDSGYEW